MKKLLLSFVACSAMLGATADDDKELTEAEIACINSSGAILSAAQIADMCLVWPVVSHLVRNSLNGALGYKASFLALGAGCAVGYLTSLSAEQFINLSVLNNAKPYGAAILTAAKKFNAYIPMGFIGFCAFLASIA